MIQGFQKPVVNLLLWGGNSLLGQRFKDNVSTPPANQTTYYDKIIKSANLNQRLKKKRVY